ncbi:MAG: transcription antitermination factor NusB [Methylococcales bacterium]|nr:transcription antitermination factor NusB [Methylococcales bacterium]MCK5924466.1 transcription antitermination factor NusB [Methylococcales bacterium]
MSEAKTKARQCAVQALYQWQMTGNDLSIIEMDFLEEDRLKGAQKSYFKALFYGVPKKLEVIDKALSEFVDRDVEKIDPVERAILRLGVYEFIHYTETPYRVIINEGVNLAKTFGAEGSHKYINGILDKIGKKIRHREIQSKS